MRCYYSITFLLLFLLACSNSDNKVLDNIKDEEVKSILTKGLKQAGTWENWINIKSIEYTKKNRLLLEDGSVEREVIERHVYTMHPNFEAVISWEEEGDNYQLKYTKAKTVKLKNGQPLDLDSERLTKSIMSSLYVLGMPFKLLDSGTTLTYNGKITLRTGREADVVKATYNSKEHDNHSTSEEWFYYFATDNGDFVGCMVYHPPTYAYIENLEFHENTPVKFHKHRKSYRTDSARNIEYLRAEFWYSDYVVK